MPKTKVSTLWWFLICSWCLVLYVASQKQKHNLAIPKIPTSLQKFPWYENMKYGNQTNVYFVRSELMWCDTLEDDPILVQYKTQHLRKVDHVLPWRPIIIWYCGRLSKIKNVNVRGIRYTIKTNYSPVSGNLTPSIFIAGKDLKPGTSFWINNKKIYVFKENQTQQIIISLNQWLNIQDKNNFRSESGVFSMFGKEYKKLFEAYAQSIPFSQSTLLQLVPLGSMDVVNVNLLPDKIKLDAQKKLSSNFVDVQYCGKDKQRRCDGGVFEGIEHCGFAYKTEGYYDRPKEYISRLLSNIKAFKLNSFDLKQSCLSRSIRTLVSELGEYTNIGVQTTEMFADPPYAAYVGTKASYVTSRKKIDNQLPHILGHTYGLRDHSGKDKLEYKVRDFQFSTTNRLVLPFFDTMQYKRDSMNGGEGDVSDEYFTSLSFYDKTIVEQRILLNNPTKIDSRVGIQNGNEDWNKYETIIVCVDKNNIFVYRINALIPTVLVDEDYVSKLPHGQDEDILKITLFNDLDEKVGERISYHSSQKMLALPQSFNEALKDNGYLLVQLKDLKKFFFVRNDAINLDPPVQGNREDVFKPIHDYTLRTSSEMDNTSLTTILEHQSYDNFIIEVPDDNTCYYRVHIDNYNNHNLGKTITIHNYGETAFDVFFNRTKTTISVPHHSVGYLTFRNGWRNVVSLSKEANSNTTSLRSKQILEYFYKNPKNILKYLNYFSNTHLKVILKGQNPPYIMVYPLTAGYFGATIMIKNESGRSKNVIIYKKQIIELQSRKTIYLEFAFGWESVILPMYHGASAKY